MTSRSEAPKAPSLRAAAEWLVKTNTAPHGSALWEDIEALRVALDGAPEAAGGGLADEAALNQAYERGRLDEAARLAATPAEPPAEPGDVSRRNVLVIDPGHGSLWIEDAEYVDRLGEPNARGRFVSGTTWKHEGGWNIPEGGIDIPHTVTYPRKWILKVETHP